MGTAYGFFNCRADSPWVIERILVDLKQERTIARNLELSVIDGVEHLRGDQALMDIARNEAKPAGIRYVMEARLPGATNERTAIELSDVFTELYHFPEIYQQGDRFCRLLVYQDEETGEYLSRE